MRVSVLQTTNKAKRPVSRKKNVTGAGKPIEKRGTVKTKKK